MCRGSLLVSILALVLALGGCASSEPPTPPLSSEAYASPWLVVPVHPSADYTEAPDSTLDAYYNRMLNEVTTTMDVYDQSYTVYADSPRYETGISADSLYEEVPESEQDDVNADRRISVDVLRAIANEADATHLFVVDPNNEVDAEKPSLLGLGAGILADGGISLGVLFPLARMLGDPKTLVTTSMFWEAKQTSGQATESVDLQPVWGGLRAATAEASGLPSGDVDAIGYGVRSMVLELKTGRAVSPRAFLVESDDPVTVYRLGQSRLRGTAVHVDDLDFVVQQRDGTVVRVPIHLVSRIKNPAQNETIF